ncbi:MAG: 8-oxo-dGTP diphosphatase MutT [Thermodesulfobacteriota bacterium]|nr:MAG: 8-oxo-dGTP diphosphatase MutT [Thermodesulfobacteriota bacterium]
MKGYLKIRMTLKVVAGFLKKGDKFLLVRRPLNKKRGGLWEFPGGKVEDGETLKEAIERELKEELGIETKAKNLVCKTIYKYPEGEIELSLLEVEFKEDPILKEALESKWVTIEESEKLELCPADMRILKNLKKTCKK